jgi:hypothetical protein
VFRGSLSRPKGGTAFSAGEMDSPRVHFTDRDLCLS